MFKGNKHNIIKNYTSKTIEKYFVNEFIDDKKILFLKKCLYELKINEKYLHLTPNLDSILESKKIFCSPGGLGGVVYTVPIDNNKKVHNLGNYILQKELPMFLKDKKKFICGICIFPFNNKIGYVDYLDFGKYYYSIYKKKKYQINEKLLKTYFYTTLQEINEVIYLSNNVKNIKKIFNIINNNKILKIYLFECILEYMFLFQKDNKTASLNNEIVKDMIYKIFPELKVNFSLSKVNFNFNKIYNYLKDSNLFYINNIKKYFISRIEFYFKKYILNQKKNLYGQIIFRKFNLRKILELDFSKLLWKEAKTKKYNVLSYIIPKGEMGILPSSRHKIYAVDLKNGFCFTNEILNVRVDSKIYFNGIMRNPYSKEEKMELPIKVQGVMYSKKSDKIEYLIIKRSKKDGGFWQGVTGTLEEGEKLGECLIREIKEELGVIDIKNISEIKETIQWAKKTGFIITEYVFSVELDRDIIIKLSEEHDDYKWCEFNEAYNLLEKENNKKTLKVINEELMNE